MKVILELDGTLEDEKILTLLDKLVKYPRIISWEEVVEDE